jgi:ABC-type hemin transport system ATPase subunit
LKLFQGRIQGTARPAAAAPPAGLLAFYWHFVRQTKGWFAAMFAASLAVALQEELLELMQGKTVIAIAHRLSTIARMDRLIVLDAGRIVEEGTHAELLRLGGHYEKLWRHQSGGFLANDVPEKSVPEKSETGTELQRVA